MKHVAKSHEHLWIRGMGKSFRVRAITNTVDEANEYMEKHKNTALIACFGPFNLIANVYEGLKDGE